MSVTRDGLVAGAIAGLVSGAPSTVHALATGRGALDATRAAGTLVAPTTAPKVVNLAGAAVAHAVISLGWGVVLARALPRRHTVVAGAGAGLAIAALDLGLVGRRVSQIRALPQLPQVLDHVAYGAVAGWVLSRLRSTPGPGRFAPRD